VSSFWEAADTIFGGLGEFGHEVSFMFYQPANKMIIKWKSANNEFSMILAMTDSLRPSLYTRLMIPSTAPIPAGKTNNRNVITR